MHVANHGSRAFSKISPGYLSKWGRLRHGGVAGITHGGPCEYPSSPKAQTSRRPSDAWTRGEALNRSTGDSSGIPVRQTRRAVRNPRLQKARQRIAQSESHSERKTRIGP